jgi:hypothetical protein
MTLPVFVPHTHLNEATRIFLAHSQALGHYIRLIDVTDDPQGYLKYLRQRWQEGYPFINIEHDIVPWPGALESLEHCPQMWCSFGYDTAAQDFIQPPLGLAKFSSEFIQALPELWEEDLPWHELDAHLHRYATERGHKAHQHRPSILNASRDSLIYLRRAGHTEL